MKYYVFHFNFSSGHFLKKNKWKLIPVFLEFCDIIKYFICLQIQGPCILQVQKIRNVSAPKDNEESQAAPRLLKLTLTDGHNSCSGVEMDTVHTVR